MAVEMVRKPSETPNIENVDDFMPIRYAYANQNGYVIGRGRIGTGIDTEAYTINGNTFTINSGRLVIQGVECDINTEHSIVIDISATKRYYAVYLQVNLATNTSDIFVTYDMLGTPILDTGEDLTINSVGTARMVLFTFEVTNGLISNVVKVVKACEYPIPYKIDEKGILKIGDIIIPQKKLLWENSNGNNVASWDEILEVGDTVEITYGYGTLERKKIRAVVFPYGQGTPSIVCSSRIEWLGGSTLYYNTLFINGGTTSINIRSIDTNYSSSTIPLIYKVIKVIE